MAATINCQSWLDTIRTNATLIKNTPIKPQKSVDEAVCIQV